MQIVLYPYFWNLKLWNPKILLQKFVTISFSRKAWPELSWGYLYCFFIPLAINKGMFCYIDSNVFDNRIAVPNPDRGDANIQKSTNLWIPKHKSLSCNSTQTHLCADWLSMCANSTGIPNLTHPKQTHDLAACPNFLPLQYLLSQ